jgi:hypothetical protein
MQVEERGQRSIMSMERNDDFLLNSFSRTAGIAQWVSDQAIGCVARTTG